LRRALSPDRLHPRTAETKSNSISPLCDPALKVTTHHVAPRVTVTTKSPPTCARSAVAPPPLVKTGGNAATCTAPEKPLPPPPRPLHSASAATAVMAPPPGFRDDDQQPAVNTYVPDGGHVSLPRIAEERDHAVTVQAAGKSPETVDKPKSAKSATGSRYFFNRKFRHNKEQIKVGADARTANVTQSPSTPPSH